MTRSNKFKFLANATVLVGMTLFMPHTVEAVSENVQRLEGPTRVETSVAVSNKAFPNATVTDVILAGYHGEADALTGTLLAVSKDAPLLLIDKFDQAIKAEFKRLGVETVHLLGGETVLNKSLEAEIKKAGYQVNRIAGTDRLETAIEIARTSQTKTDHVFLTNDGRTSSLADALAVGPIAGREKEPILLTTKDTLSEVTLQAMQQMGIKKVTIVGGTGAVSDEVESTLKSKGMHVDRIAGKDRAETAQKIASTYFSQSKKAIVTNDGRISFADALLGGYLGAKKEAPILLTQAHQIDAETTKFLVNQVDKAYVLGGSSVVTHQVAEKIANAVARQAGWQQIDGIWYYINEQGETQTGWNKIDHSWYYMNAEGAMQTGWLEVSGKKYYLNTNGIMQTGWLELNNEWYHFNTEGVMSTGFVQEEGRWYYLNENGMLEDLTILDENPTNQQFINAISKYAVKIAEDNDIYASVMVAQAALETGYGKSGLSKAPNHNLFGIKASQQDIESGQAVMWRTQEHNEFGETIWIETAFKKYPSYMESLQDNADRLLNGRPWNPLLYQGTWKSQTNNYTDATAALTGVYATDISYYQKLNSIIERFELYKLDGGTLVTNPTLARGWNKIDNKFYYVDANGVKLTGWQQIKGKWYYLGTTGERATGWIYIKNTWYYLDDYGAMQTGWLKQEEDWYYLNTDGSMQVGQATIDGKNYVFDSSGKLQ